MTRKCLKPINAWVCGCVYARDGVMSQNLIFSYDKAFEYYARVFGDYMLAQHHCDENMTLVDCGKCVACQMRKRKDMATRLRHELSMHEECCFITLTYDEASLPRTDCGKWSEGERTISRGDFFGEPTLLPADVQKFMKRLRRHLEYKPLRLKDRRDHVTTPLRYFAVGEYGSRTRRPHYHILIMGWKPSDMEIHQYKKTYCIYRSAQIEKLWTHGFSTVAEVRGGVASYCARYVTKKFARLTDMRPEDEWICPEFVLQSVRGGGMGAPWLAKYYEMLRSGYVTSRNGRGVIVKSAIPKYYYDRLRKTRKEFWLDLRDERIDFIQRNPNLFAKDYRAVEQEFEDLFRKCESFEHECKKELDSEVL